MNPPLDDLLRQLAREPADVDLTRTEAEVWKGIARDRRAQALDAWLLPARASAVMLALSLGAALGAAHDRNAYGRPEIAAFEVASTYAPSALLDHP